MTFSLAKPGTWAVNEKITSAQLNQLDLDHVKSLDKTGDSITTGLIQVTTTGEIRSTHAAGITSTAQFGIRTSTVDGINTDVDGGISLSGSTNYPRLLPARSVLRAIPPVPSNPIFLNASGWGLPGNALIGAAGTEAALIEIPNPHHGSVLTTVDCIFAVGAAHGGVPAVLPKFEVKRVQDLTTLGVAYTATDQHLNSAGGASFPTPGSGAAYYAAGVLQRWTLTCDMNATIDRTKYRYYIQLIDEHNSNAVAGNVYLGFIATYTQISTMAFP